MYEPSAALRADMRSKGIDADLTLSLLADYNAGLYDGIEPVKASGVPLIDGREVLSLSGGRRPPEAAGPAIAVDERDARDRLGGLGIAVPPGAEKSAGGLLSLDRAALEEIGLSLLGRTAFGVLNGGSATSYADSKKNRAFGDRVFEALAAGFEALAPLCEDKPKGLTPAYIDPDGTPGASFLLLKMRARLIAALEAKRRGEKVDGSFMPLFQMTSVGNDVELAAAYEEYRSHPFLAPLSREAGIDGTSWATGVQPMIAAYTHSDEGRPKRIFDRARGQPDSALALPGGHGQCFRVLAPVLRDLRAAGARFAYLGNVDNLGYLPDPAEIAALAVSGKPAAFDFSLRTPVDVKGGVLVRPEQRAFGGAAAGARDGAAGGAALTIADIGPAIPFAEVERLETEGFPILFNCATGLFDLDWLVPRLDEIARKLPVRFTDQDKDAGRYSQAEQVTWEVAGILPSFLAFAVDKYDRFIAAKLLVETLLTSGTAAGDPRLPPELAETSSKLSAALGAKLSGPYGLVRRGGSWVPAG